MYYDDDDTQPLLSDEYETERAWALQDQMHDEQMNETPSYSYKLICQYESAIHDYTEIIEALKKDPLDPRYTLRNTRYKYKSGRSTADCAARNRISTYEKQRQTLKNELRQRLTWLVEFFEDVHSNVIITDNKLEDYFDLRIAKDYLKEVAESEKETKG